MSEHGGGLRAHRGRRIGALPVGRSLSVTIGLLLVFAVAGLALALIADSDLSDSRYKLLEEIGPSLRSALELEDAIVNQETGVRGFIIAGQPSFLSPYEEGIRRAAGAAATIRSHTSASGAVVAGDLEEVDERTRGWRSNYVEPALAAVRAGHKVPPAITEQGKDLFDALRGSLSALYSDLDYQDRHTRSQLNSAASFLEAMLILAAVLIIGSLIAAGLFLRTMIQRPLSRLGEEARRVAGGDFRTPLTLGTAPAEFTALGREVDVMRSRIVQELGRVSDSHELLARQAQELRSSNAELEQFAYVASHDLQEPLRKVASFCQALQKRYADQLDERANQYIDFAVDGATRMQTLINALLALSRVGRVGDPPEQVAMADILAGAERALSSELSAAGGRVEVLDPLPLVRGQRALLLSLMQNLIGNALKFAASEPPLVRIGCRADEAAGEWVFSCQDNGIGIEPQYAERIFQIFQRLHNREAYEGTGIGLALCRKIVEHHGGRIWLDPDWGGPGARFCFSLPRDGEPPT